MITAEEMQAKIREQQERQEAQRQARRLGIETTSPTISREGEDKPPQFLPKWAIQMRQDYEARLKQAEEKNHELEMAIVKAANAGRQETSLVPSSLYGSEHAVQEMSSQMKVSPKFSSLNEAECDYVARVGLASGLNPEFDLHAWTNDRWDKKLRRKVRVLSILPDYKALIRKSDRRFLMLKEIRLSADEMRARGISDRDIQEGSIAYIIEGWELDKAALAKTAGITYEPLRGYGFCAACKDDEVWDEGKSKYIQTGKRVPNDVPNTKDILWQAKKRAMRDLFNQMADMSLKFTAPTGATIIDDDTYQVDSAALQLANQKPGVIEGTFTETTPARWQDNPERRENAEKWLVSIGVTDVLLNEALNVTDWRSSDIPDAEFRMAAELLKSTAPEVTAMENAPLPGDDKPASEATPLTKQERSTTDAGHDEALEIPPAAKDTEYDPATDVQPMSQKTWTKLNGHLSSLKLMGCKRSDDVVTLLWNAMVDGAYITEAERGNWGALYSKALSVATVYAAMAKYHDTQQLAQAS